jgi:hypothetical protein
MDASNVRPEYARLGRDFVRVARGFGIALEEQARRDVAQLAAAIEHIDRVLDAIDARGERDAFGAALVLALRTGDARAMNAWGEELTARVRALHETLARRCAVERFARVTDEALANVEALRAATTRDAFVACVVLEGRLTAEMALLVAGDACTDAFRRFFVALGEPANLVDKLLDARDDYARGEMTLAPSLHLHARLALEIAHRVPRLCATYPRPMWLVAWGAGYLLAPGEGRFGSGQRRRSKTSGGCLAPSDSR